MYFQVSNLKDPVSNLKRRDAALEKIRFAKLFIPPSTTHLTFLNVFYGQRSVQVSIRIQK